MVVAGGITPVVMRTTIENELKMFKLSSVLSFNVCEQMEFFKKSIRKEFLEI